ncbi:hypothetical protein FAY30_27025 (plasmid) [Bacillus sp. S3]|nr:hypothetical protein FAY30_27025 [Bacillus sp. S3]
MTKLKASTRIEIRRLKSSRGSTVEIELLHGDGVLVLKHSYIKTVLQNPTKVEIDNLIEEYIHYAEEANLI